MEITEHNNHKTVAQLLREIVTDQQVDELIDHLYNYYYSWKKDSQDQQIDLNKMRVKYVEAINDITHQPTRAESSGTIVVEYDHAVDAVHDITYTQPDDVDDHTPYSLQFLPWDVVANSQLTYPGLSNKAHAVAYVLHEITFFGFTSDEQKEHADKTFEIDDSELDHFQDINEWFQSLEQASDESIELPADNNS
jgi:hypothetical protein